jgi:uncharacterized protein with FMN-binding domain
MKKAVIILAVVAAVAVAVLGQDPASNEAEKAAVIATALDYSDGAYSADAERMAGAIHPDLNKLIFGKRPPATNYMSSYSTFSGLVEFTRAAGLVLEPEKRLTEAAVLEIAGDVACARIRTAMWCDYLQMIKAGGRWKIVNVLWTSGLNVPPQAKAVPGFDAEKERPAAQAAALDFLEGRLNGDAARLEKALHPETSIAVYMIAAKTGGAFLNRSRYSGILEQTRAKLGLPPENARTAEVRVLDLMDGMAFAAAKTGVGAAYLQLQLLDGQWKAINVLVRPTNNVMGAPAPPPAKK